jgi:hypothetical protein
MGTTKNHPEREPISSLLIIRLQGSEGGAPSLLDVSSFLYDFNLLYEISRLATDPNYHDFRFSDFVMYRNGRPLAEYDRLLVAELRKESPLLLVTALAAVPTVVGAVWGVVQIVEKVTNARLERRKLRAEIEKLERENRPERQPPLGVNFESPEQLRTVLRIREAETYYDKVGGRLERSSVRIKELQIEVVTPDQLRKPE